MLGEAAEPALGHRRADRVRPVVAAEAEAKERSGREKEFARLEEQHLSAEKNMGQLFDRLLLEVIRLADVRRSTGREERSSVDR